MYRYVSWFVFLSLSLSLNVCNSVRLFYHSLYLYTYVSCSVFVSFVWIFLSLFGCVVTNCTCISTSLDPRFSLFLSASQCLGILSVICLYVQERPARPVCNTKKKKKKKKKRRKKKRKKRVNFACIHTSLDLYFFLFRAECLQQFSDILWLIFCPYTSLGRVCFFLSEYLL